MKIMACYRHAMAGNSTIKIQNTGLSLQPVNELEQTDGQWESTGHDPQFYIHHEHGFKPGWYRIEVKIDADMPARPKVYLDVGNGFNEMEAATLYPTAKGQFGTTINFRTVPSIVRFDPVDMRGSFKLVDVSIKPLSRLHFWSFAAGKAGRLLLRDPIGNFGRVLRSGRSLLGGQRFFSINPQVSTPDSAKDTYAIWRASYDYDPKTHRAALEDELLALTDPPKISILMPVYNTDAKLLDETIQSVMAQVYKNWELCIANDASTAAHIRPQLDSWAEKDARIKVVHREENGHISAASNSALNLVSAEWVAMLDHDDALPEHALAKIALAIQNNPDIQLIYSDEDKISPQGERVDPAFKPDFSPELFRSMNYLNHLTVHRTENIHAVGGWSDEHKGSQDYDLNLKIWERIGDAAIHHIPEVLYHWRAVEGSTALAQGEKNYALDAAHRAVSDHLDRVGFKATAEIMDDLPYIRVRPELPDPQPMVSLIIPTYNRHDLVLDCIDSIQRLSGYKNYEIIVVDNNSNDPDSRKCFEHLKASGMARVLKYPYKFNFSAINNFAVKRAKGEIIALVNNDIEATSQGWLAEMVSWAAQDRVGCVGAKLHFVNDQIQHAGVILGIGGVAGHAHKYLHRDDYGYGTRAQVLQNLSAVTAALLVVRKSVFEEVGGLNKKDLVVAFNDIDFCLKVRSAGYLNIYTPFAQAYHYESISRGQEDDPEKIARFNSEIDYMLKQWGPQLARDPYYSPNLSATHEDFRLRGL